MGFTMKQLTALASLALASAQIIAPAADTVLEVNKEFELTWNTEGLLDTVTVQVISANEADNKAVAFLVAEDAANNGSLVFTPDAKIAPFDTYAILLTDQDDTQVESAPFKISLKKDAAERASNENSSEGVDENGQAEKPTFERPGESAEKEGDAGKEDEADDQCTEDGTEEADPVETIDLTKPDEDDTCEDELVTQTLGEDGPQETGKNGDGKGEEVEFTPPSSPVTATTIDLGQYLSTATNLGELTRTKGDERTTTETTQTDTETTQTGTEASTDTATETGTATNITTGTETSSATESETGTETQGTVDLISTASESSSGDETSTAISSESATDTPSGTFVGGIPIETGDTSRDDDEDLIDENDNDEGLIDEIPNEEDNDEGLIDENDNSKGSGDENPEGLIDEIPADRASATTLNSVPRLEATRGAVIKLETGTDAAALLPSPTAVLPPSDDLGSDGNRKMPVWTAGAAFVAMLALVL